MTRHFLSTVCEAQTFLRVKCFTFPSDYTDCSSMCHLLLIISKISVQNLSCMWIHIDLPYLLCVFKCYRTSTSPVLSPLLSLESPPLHLLPAESACLYLSWSSPLCERDRASAARLWSKHWNRNTALSHLVEQNLDFSQNKYFIIHTYWSSVPKNFTKWHFLPLGFFRSLGGLTTCNLNKCFSTSVVWGSSHKCKNLLSFNPVNGII